MWIIRRHCFQVHFSRFHSHRRRCHGDAVVESHELEREGGFCGHPRRRPSLTHPPDRRVRTCQQYTAERAYATIARTHSATHGRLIRMRAHAAGAARLSRRAACPEFFPRTPAFLRPETRPDISLDYWLRLGRRPQNVWVNPTACDTLTRETKTFFPTARSINNKCVLSGDFFVGWVSRLLHPCPSDQSASSFECPDFFFVSGPELSRGGAPTRRGSRPPTKGGAAAAAGKPQPATHSIIPRDSLSGPAWMRRATLNRSKSRPRASSRRCCRSSSR